MSLVDLHVHSRYSGYPSEEILKASGFRESYTEIDAIYRIARSRGMDFVTVTDHNSLEGSLELVRRYPGETFTGVEFTVQFPEDGCRVHILCFDLTPAQFAVLDSLRPDIYAFRDYLRNKRIAYSLAHATFAVNGKLAISTLEKLILLFDVFEGINGSRSVVYNHIWTRVLNHLTPQDIDRMYQRHQIEPMSDDPWIKGLTGGSDDHAGLYIGKTFTRSDTDSLQDFLEALRCKKTISSGRSNHFAAMTFLLGKIAAESRTASGTAFSGLWGWVIRKIFYPEARLGIKNRVKLMSMRASRRPSRRLLADFIMRIRRKAQCAEAESPDERVESLYEDLADLSDGLLKTLVMDLQKAWNRKKAGEMLRGLSHSLTQVYMTVPFLGAWKLLNTNRHLVQELRERFGHSLNVKEKKVLWFSDTIADLNGVSSTLRKIADFSRKEGYHIKMVVCAPDLAKKTPAGSTKIFLDSIGSFCCGLYPSYRMHFPSLLKSLKRLEAEHADEIVISTPGPVGLLGLLAARLSGIKATAVYHTDFAEQMKYVSSGAVIVKIFDYYLRWFYARADEVRVPSREYLAILQERGYQLSRAGVFQRGIDQTLFYEDPAGARRFRRAHGIQGRVLLYAGRVSEDKNISFLGDIYREICRSHPETSLVVAGDGPALASWRQSLADLPRAVFLGGLEREELRAVYCAADLMVFPSVTDTFGMAVLEAQACGLPCLVSDRGGPQSIVRDRVTGYVLSADNRRAWISRMDDILCQLRGNAQALIGMREQAARMVREHFDWDRALQDLLGGCPSGDTIKKSPHKMTSQDPEYSLE